MKAMLAVDVHDEPERVLALARPILIQLGAAVDILYVSEARTEIPQDPGAYARWQSARDAEQAILEGLMEALPQGIRGEVRIHPGHPRDSLPHISGDYDLMLIGTHSRRVLARIMIGSVADHMVRHARCPVTVLRTNLPRG